MSLLFQRCRGEYLALLNGDDEWTDENKLQIQADLLDSEKDVSMCYHRSFVIDELSDQKWETEFTGTENELPVEKLFHGFNPIMTASVMCRNPGKLPDWYEDVPYGDMPLYLMLSEKGKIRYIDRTMCLYRIHASGNWQGDTLKSNLLKDLKYYKLINEKFDHRYNGFIKKILTLRYLSLTILSIRNDEYSEANIYYNELLKSDIGFLEKRNIEIQTLRKILDDNSLKNNYSELISTDPGWKII
ncbi:MAG: hypothetical protein IPM38_16775 [Ignavibacteria bacterium]|nr:hypothetical protein [Ignavibacteria bacterium]